jgi:hypothetical protein
MRILLLSLGLAAFGSSAPAQQSAEVTVIAQVRIPDFLNVQVGAVTESTLEDGQHLRRVTLHVTANRSWTLTVNRTQASNGSDAKVKLSKSEGKRGQHTVVVEFRWNANERGPAPNEFQYVLGGT